MAPANKKTKGKSVAKNAYDKIRAQIEQGIYPLGCQIPSVVKICDEYGVSHVTAFRVVRKLAEEGYVETKSGKSSEKGTFVISNTSNAEKKKMRQVHTLFFPLDKSKKIDHLWQNILLTIQFHLGRRKTIMLNYPNTTGHGNNDGFLKQIDSSDCDGVLLFQFTDEKIIEQIRQRGIPAVIVNRFVDAEGISSVVADYKTIGEKSAEMAAEKNYKRFLFYRVPEGGKNDPVWNSCHYFVQNSIEKHFSAKIKELTGKTSECIPDCSADKLAEYIDDYINDPDSCMLCMGPYMPKNIYQILTKNKDKRVKNNGLISVNIAQLEASISPLIPTWTIDPESLATEAVRLLAGMMRGKLAAGTSITPVKFIDRI
ncbi:MAG: GntR family transcriptional regulator [Planctomycetota bacterium]|jgi:DNA-binding LacI/PurR family transcriptional regulator